MTSIVISIVSIIIAGINLWFNVFRKTRKLFAVPLNEPGELRSPRFAIINGSNSDVLLVSLNLSFQNKEMNGSMTPAQDIAWEESKGMLIEKGKAIHCIVEFKEMGPGVCRNGIMDPLNPTITLKDMLMVIEWISIDGKLHKRKITIAQYGFNESGDIRSKRPLIQSAELYSGKVQKLS